MPDMGSYSGTPKGPGEGAYRSGGGKSGTTDGWRIITGRSRRISLLYGNGEQHGDPTQQTLTSQCP